METPCWRGEHYLIFSFTFPVLRIYLHNLQICFLTLVQRHGVFYTIIIFRFQTELYLSWHNGTSQLMNDFAFRNSIEAKPSSGYLSWLKNVRRLIWDWKLGIQSVNDFAKARPVHDLPSTGTISPNSLCTRSFPPSCWTSSLSYQSSNGVKFPERRWIWTFHWQFHH